MVLVGVFCVICWWFVCCLENVLEVVLWFCVLVCWVLLLGLFWFCFEWEVVKFLIFLKFVRKFRYFWVGVGVGECKLLVLGFCIDLLILIELCCCVFEEEVVFFGDIMINFVLGVVFMFGGFGVICWWCELFLFCLVFCWFYWEVCICCFCWLICLLCWWLKVVDVLIVFIVWWVCCLVFEGWWFFLLGWFWLVDWLLLIWFIINLVWVVCCCCWVGWDWDLVCMFFCWFFMEWCFGIMFLIGVWMWFECLLWDSGVDVLKECFCL